LDRQHHVLEVLDVLTCGDEECILILRVELSDIMMAHDLCRLVIVVESENA
jgi:hypothetical protein